MSLLNLAFPAQAAVPTAQALIAAAASIARPLIGLSIFAVLLVVFKPLLTGMLRAAMLAVKPRTSRAEQAQRNRAKSVLMLNRMARELETSQPNLASELRFLACRD